MQLMGKAADELEMVDKLVVEKEPKLTSQQQKILNDDCSA